MKKLNSFINKKIIKEYNLSKAHNEISNAYFYFVDKKQSDFEGMGKWLAETIVEMYRSATYGGYAKKAAQSDLNEFMSGWKSVSKRI